MTWCDRITGCYKTMHQTEIRKQTLTEDRRSTAETWKQDADTQRYPHQKMEIHQITHKHKHTCTNPLPYLRTPLCLHLHLHTPIQPPPTHTHTQTPWGRPHETGSRVFFISFGSRSDCSIFANGYLAVDSNVLYKQRLIIILFWYSHIACGGLI